MSIIANAASLTTAEQLLATPDDENRCELIEGVLHRMMSPSGGQHGIVAARVLRRLGNFVEENQIGAVFAAETGFLLSRDPDTVRAPDVAFVCKRRLEDAGTITGYWPGAPDLAIEVVSPNDASTQVEAKAHMWLSAGTALVLIADPATKTVRVYRTKGAIEVLVGTDVLDAYDVVPGWKLAVSELFD